MGTGTAVNAGDNVTSTKMNLKLEDLTLMAAGTVGAPSLTWAGGAATGFYQIAANNIGYAVSGVKEIDWGAALYRFGAGSTGTNQADLGVNSGSGASAQPLFSLLRNSVRFLIMGLSGGAGNIIAGSAANEACFRTTNTRMLFSADDGTTLHAQMTAAGLWIPTVARVRVTYSSSFVLASGGSTAVPWDVETYDNDTMHAPGAATRLTATRAGTYLIIASVGFGAVAGGYRQVICKKNGLTDVAGPIVTGSSAGTQTVVVVTVEALAAADYVEFFATQNSGSNVTVGGDYASMTMIGA